MRRLSRPEESVRHLLRRPHDVDGADARRAGAIREKVADALFHKVPAGVGRTGRIRLDARQMEAMLTGGARWAVERGFGERADLDRIESGGRVEGARPSDISPQARKRQEEEMGTLGSGNHYLEVQEVVDLFDEATARAWGLRRGGIVVSIHCGSRGLGHQVATEYSKKMLAAAKESGLCLPDRELACAPIGSPVGQAYLGAMRSAINCALANRQIIMHLVREALAPLADAGECRCSTTSRTTRREEEHPVDGVRKRPFVHRKGATCLRSGDPSLPEPLRATGQPVLIGGATSTASYILAARRRAVAWRLVRCAWRGPQMSRTQATQRWQGRR